MGAWQLNQLTDCVRQSFCRFVCMWGLLTEYTQCMSSAEESLEKRQLIEKDARQIAEETRDLQLLEEELREQLYVMRSKKEQKQQRIHNQAEITRRHSAVLDDLRKQCRELDAQRNMLKNTIAQNEQASARSRAVRAKGMQPSRLLMI